jgi:hypothetical protein
MGVIRQLKRFRDQKGKFRLKNSDYRQVRSLRLTDSTWKALGDTAESNSLSRADLLENLVKQNKGIFPYPVETEKLHEEIKLLKQQLDFQPLDRVQLLIVAQRVLSSLRLGKQASSYKLVQKSLKKFIELILPFAK